MLNLLAFYSIPYFLIMVFAVIQVKNMFAEKN